MRLIYLDSDKVIFWPFALLLGVNKHAEFFFDVVVRVDMSAFIALVTHELSDFVK